MFRNEATSLLFDEANTVLTNEYTRAMPSITIVTESTFLLSFF